MGDLVVDRKFVFCLIIVVIFIGLRRAYRLGGMILNLSNGGKTTYGSGPFYQRS